MAETDSKQVSGREIREAELQMTGRPPASATGFIGFVPAAPATSNGDGGQSTTTGAGNSTQSNKN